jgi:hypothetical protein
MMCDVIADNHRDGHGNKNRDDNVKKRKLDSMNQDTYAVVRVLDDVDVVNGLRKGRDSDGHDSSGHSSDHHVGVDERESLNEEAIRLKSSIR